MIFANAQKSNYPNVHLCKTKKKFFFKQCAEKRQNHVGNHATGHDEAEDMLLVCPCVAI